MKWSSPLKHLSFGLALTILLTTEMRCRAESRPPDCYVLAVGVDRYQKSGLLKGCVNDARNIVSGFRAQGGKRFGKVVSRTLVDEHATQSNISREMHCLKNQGKAGDFVVLFLSGHGGRDANTHAWYFLPCDYDAAFSAHTRLGDRQLLDVACALVERGKKVLIIIDACFAGQLRLTARDCLNRYRDPTGGGLILLLSSRSDQTSAALGQYSAYAKSVVDALAGPADRDGDGFITLGELRHYAYHHTHELRRQHGISPKQDSESAWSPSISDTFRLAAVPQARIWVGGEDLSGYGKLAFHIYPNGWAVMVDSRGRWDGTWQHKDKTVILRFFNNTVVYTGKIALNTVSGTAQNGRTSWTWNVRRQPDMGLAPQVGRR